MFEGKELDELLEKLTRPIELAYSRMELELIKDIANRLNTYDEIGGLLEWRIQKLNDLGAINYKTIQRLAHLTGQSIPVIQEALEQVVGSTLDLNVFNKAYEVGQIVVDPSNIILTRVLQSRYNEISDTVELIQNNMLDSTRQEYLRIVDKVYLESSTGIKTPQQAIQDGIMDLAEKGISGATYMRQGKEYEMHIEPVVRRDVTTTLIQSSNKIHETYTEFMGAEHVYVTQHVGARNIGNDYRNHEMWQGKVYKVSELKEKTGYGEMLGLGGINCRHIHYAYFKGISPPPPPKIDTKENARVYELSQKQRGMERNIRKQKRKVEIAKVVGDEELIKKEKAKLNSRYAKINAFIKDNSDVLRRDFSRERIQ